jgi:putative transposase
VSRYVLAWRLSNLLDSRFCVEALEDALTEGQPEIFNTDQGSQLTGADFIDVLRVHGFAISMNGRGRFTDNIFVERLWRSLKYEEIYLKAYQNVTEAGDSIVSYFKFYNQERLHQALSYPAPRQVFDEAAQLTKLARRRKPLVPTAS